MTIDELIDLDRQKPRKIAVIGDSMTDVWVHGDVDTSQEHCPRLRQHRIVKTPGGAANAVRSLYHWFSKAHLISPWLPPITFTEDESFEAFSQVDTEMCLDRDVKLSPQKTRYLVDDHVVFRHDNELPRYGMNDEQMAEARRLALLAIRSCEWDAVLICDYDKGFLTREMLLDIAGWCQARQIPCFADAKRHPSFYPGMLLQCNASYADRHLAYLTQTRLSCLITRGSLPPHYHEFRHEDEQYPPLFLHGSERCVNHVGAGDCFAAHLALLLAQRQGISLCDGDIAIAHAAGQVYVQYEHNRPPWPHETRRQMGSKVILQSEVRDLAASLAGKAVVFTNGVFRIPHAGHAWLLDWARQKGEVLVVGINDDVSAFRQKPGEYVLPLDERIRMLSTMACVDWIIPYSEDDPGSILRLLRPARLVKGNEYAGVDIPGRVFVGEVMIAPESPYGRHASDLVSEIKSG